MCLHEADAWILHSETSHTHRVTEHPEGFCMLLSCFAEAFSFQQYNGTPYTCFPKVKPFIYRHPKENKLCWASSFLVDTLSCERTQLPLSCWSRFSPPQWAKWTTWSKSPAYLTYTRGINSSLNPYYLPSSCDRVFLHLVSTPNKPRLSLWWHFLLRKYWDSREKQQCLKFGWLSVHWRKKLVYSNYLFWLCPWIRVDCHTRGQVLLGKS